MKRNLKSTITHLRRRFAIFIGHLGTRSEQRMKRPKMTQSEEQATRIWTKVVHQVDSDLMYNPQTHEAYAQWESPGGTIYLFLEAGNLRVINTVVGYDIRLSARVEQWCSSIFTREVSKRRNKFRKGAESKVIHSLDSLESRLDNL
jgi:hypothetical protein